MARSYYDVLGVAEDAGQEAIGKAYRQAMAGTGPDLHSQSDAKRVRELNAAHGILANPELRHKYDLQLQKMRESQKSGSVSQASGSTRFLKLVESSGDSLEKTSPGQQLLVKTESRSRNLKTRSATGGSFTATMFWLSSIVLGGVAGIGIGVVLLWVIWERDPLGIIPRNPIARQQTEERPGKDTVVEPLTPIEKTTEPLVADDVGLLDSLDLQELDPESPPSANVGEVDRLTPPEPTFELQTPAEHFSELLVSDDETESMVAVGSAAEETLRSRLPVPDQKAQQRFREDLREVFESRYQESRQLRDEGSALRALAEEIGLLHSEEEDLVGRYVLLKMAVRIAIESADSVLTFEIIDDLSGQFEIDDLSLRINAVNIWSGQAAKRFRKEELRKKRLQLLDQIVPLAERATSEYRFFEAAELYNLASKQANHQRQVEFRKFGFELRKKADKHARMMQLAEQIQSSTEKSAGEEMAEWHLTLGIYWCFELGDWRRGLTHLAVSSSEKFSEIAQLDLDSQAHLDDAESVGHRWWEFEPAPRFYRYKESCKARAAYWYALALGDKKGLARKKLEGRIARAGLVLDESEMVLESIPAMPVNFRKGLVAYYPFNGNARDESHNGNDGTVKGAVSVADRHGQEGKAYRFNGKSSEIQLDEQGFQEQLDRSKSGFAVTAWIQWNKHGKISSILRNDFDYNLYVDVDGVLFAERFLPAKKEYSFIKSAESLPLGKWIHVCCIYKVKTFELFIDGKLVASTTGHHDIPLSVAVQDAPLTVGYSSIYRQVATGLIDDVRIYGRGLSAREVKTLYEFECGLPPKTTRHRVGP